MRMRMTINSSPCSKSNNKEKLKNYQDVKKSMLGSFYVGAKGPDLAETKHYSPIRYSECSNYEFKGRRGKVWHGRPPVKIIEKE